MDSLKQIRARLRDLRARVGNSIVEMGGIEVPAGEAEDGGLYHIDRAVADLTAHISGGYNSPSDLDGSTDDGSTEPEPTDGEGAAWSDGFERAGATKEVTVHHKGAHLPSPVMMQADRDGFGWANLADGTVAEGRGRGGGDALLLRYPQSASESDDAFPQANLHFGSLMPRELWIGYDLLVPENFVHRDPETGSSNNKFFQVWGPSGRGSAPRKILEYRRVDAVGSGDRREVWIRDGTEPGPLANQFFGGFNNPYRAADAHPFITEADLGTWMRVRWHFRVGDPSSPEDTGLVELWKNDTLFHSGGGANDLTADDPADNHFSDLRLLGWSNSGWDEQTDFLFDNLGIHTSDPDW